MKSLFIIDDDPTLNRALQRVFERDYRVRTAISVEQAHPQITSDPPDVILLDFSLPGKDGQTFLQQLRREHPALPVVVISGTASSRDAVEALEIGAADFVRKPFDIQELRLRVERALALRAGPFQQMDDQNADRQSGQDPQIPLKEAVEQFERVKIEEALRACNGVVTKAAERIGTTRRILQYRIKKLNIDVVAKNAEGDAA